MVYTDVIKQDLHLLLPKKKKYTFRDLKKVLRSDSNLSLSESRFIVICTAIFHDVEYSKTVNLPTEELQLKLMF